MTSSYGAPHVTVVVPCLNEEPHIRRMMGSLLESTYPREKLEVIFVDGMSTDATRKALQEFVTAHDFIRVLDNPYVVTPAALNIGIRAAKGEIIVRMDAHAEFPPDYIARCVSLLQSHPNVGSAGGRSVRVPNGDGPWARAVAFVTAHKFGVGKAAYLNDLRPGPVDTVAFGAFRRSVLERVGMYDERLTRNQDNELHARLKRASYTVAFDPGIVSYYRNRPSLGALVRQGFVAGMWNVYTLCLHPYTFAPRRFVPLAFVTYLALAPAVAALGPRWAAAAAAPLAAYLGLLAVCSFGAGGPVAYRLRVAATFGAYHLAYGAGPVAGLFNVISGRWRAQLGKPVGGVLGARLEASHCVLPVVTATPIQAAAPGDIDGIIRLLHARPPAYWMTRVAESGLRTFLAHVIESGRATLLVARAPEAAEPAGYVLAIQDARAFWLLFALKHPALALEICCLRVLRLSERRRATAQRPKAREALVLPEFAWSPSDPRSARIVGLFVSEEFRRRGIAMDLYFKLFEALKKKGATLVEEYMGEDYMEYAGKFPEVCGWRPQTCRCGGYKIAKEL